MNKKRVISLIFFLIIIEISYAAFAKYSTSKGNIVAKVKINASDGGVYAKLYDTDNDEIGDTLVLNRKADFTYKGVLIDEYKNQDNNVAQEGNFTIWHKDAKKVRKVVINSKIKPITTNSWFANFEKLTEIIDIEKLDTSKVTDMSRMFIDCEILEYVNLTHFDTSNVTDMTRMFNICSSLKSLDLSSFDTTNVISTKSMFFSCSSLKTIYVSNKFNLDNVENSDVMFKNCESIVGQNGTTYNPDLVDKSMANYLNGYLTLKGEI